MKLLARLLVIAGIAFLGLGLYLLWERNDASRLSFTNYQYSESEKKQISEKNLPVKVAITELNLDLQVIPAELKDKNWETTKDGVSYLTSSPIPGEVGNSVMYAHNWAGLFQTLPQIKPGNKVEITYADKSKKTFAIAYTLEVSPGDISVLEQSKDNRLTLYTCTGFLDAKRFVAVAFLQQ